MAGVRGWSRPVFVAACVVCGAARATFLDGATLLERLEASGSDLNYAVGFVVGIADAAEGRPTPEGEECFHLPSRVDSMMLARQVRRFIARNRPLQQEPAAPLVRAALAEGWPCRGRAPGMRGR